MSSSLRTSTSGLGLLRFAPLLAVPALLLVPSFVGDYRMLLANLMLVNIITVLGLVVLLGWSGQFAFTSAAFMGVGAYSGARYATLHEGLPLEGALLLGLLTGTVIGTLFGLLAVRVRRYYLAIVTIAFMYLVQLWAREAEDYTGGVDGFLATQPGVATLGGRTLTSATEQYYVGLVLTGLVLLFVLWLRRTPLARGWVTLKTDDRYAKAVGVDVYRSRLAAFVIASAIFSLAGTWFTFVTQFVYPETFGFGIMMTHFIFLVVGGVTSPIGAAIAAAVLTVVSEEVRSFIGVSEIIYGIILLASVLLMRNGLYGVFHAVTKLKERWA
jgi:branched-chain amino acid transport system permease protein